MDVSRLDLRVGGIVSIRCHPLAEMLSVLEVDVGENSPRVVVSKLGGKTLKEEASPSSLCVTWSSEVTEGQAFTLLSSLQLQGRLSVLLCNVKACKLKGVVSQARLLWCAGNDDITELLTPPPGSVPGDRVTFLDYPGTCMYGGRRAPPPVTTHMS